MCRLTGGNVHGDCNITVLEMSDTLGDKDMTLIECGNVTDTKFNLVLSSAKDAIFF